MKLYTVSIRNHDPQRATQLVDIEALNERAALAKAVTNYLVAYSVLETPLTLTLRVEENVPWTGEELEKETYIDMKGLDGVVFNTKTTFNQPE